MNSLPLISHHLFASAVGNEGPAPRPPRPKQAAPVTVKGIVTELPFELLEAVESPEPAAATRSWNRSEAGRGAA